MTDVRRPANPAVPHPPTPVPLTPEQDADITARAETDPDLPPTTDEQLAQLRPAAEGLPHFVCRRRP